MAKKTYKQKIKDLEDLLKIQGDEGNWNYDQYMHGMYNGMALALGVITDTEPPLKKAPKKWLYKKNTTWVENLINKYKKVFGI